MIAENETQRDYINRINKVFTFIDENLDADLSLNTISEIAFFSPFHFHRIFKIITGETLNEYVTRRRIEKAANFLIHKSSISISELSLEIGFNKNSSFTRAFKKFYGISPTEFRTRNSNNISKISQLESKNGQEKPTFDEYFCNITNLKKWIEMNAKIEIKEMSKVELAYVSCIGQNNLMNAYHDSFKITEPGKVRMSACVILKKSIKVGGEVGLTTIERGRFIVGSFKIKLNEFEKSWTGLFIWMNEKGYKKVDRNPFEIYHNNFNEHPEKICIVDFYIPIE